MLGFRNWVSKIDNCKILGRPIFRGRLQYTKITTINMYLFIEIGYTFHIQCHGDCIEMKKLIICLKLIFLEIPHKKIGCPEG